MKKELPSIYKNAVDKKVTRNLEEYHISNKSLEETFKKNNSYSRSELTVDEKLKHLFQSKRYVFNIPVEIITNHKTYDTKIAGKVKNSIVTIDGDTIPIIEIEDLIIKDRI